MKRTHKIFIAMGVLTLLLGGGTASATYAWYQLSYQRTIALSGTALGKDANITLGVVSDADLDEKFFAYSASETLAESERLKDGQKIYWFTEETISDAAVKSFLSANGYASDTLYPVTSGKYAKGDEFKLYDSPALSLTFDEYHYEADKDMYLCLPLVFKAGGGTDMSVSHVSVGTKFLLSEMNVYGQFSEAARIYMHSDTMDCLFNPNSFNAAKTAVGGPMDIDVDGQYDYISGNDGKQYEVCYGQHDGTLVYGTPYSDTVDTTKYNYDCFSNPDHTEGVYPLSDTTDVVSYANYESQSNYLYQSNDENQEMGDYTPVCITDSSGLGFLDITIYLEGWDHAIVNSNVGKTFGTSFKFLYAGNASSN